MGYWLDAGCEKLAQMEKVDTIYLSFLSYHIGFAVVSKQGYVKSFLAIKRWNKPSKQASKAHND